MISVTGSIPCAKTLVESDQWIPLKITWFPRYQGRPLYARISAPDRGEIEIKVSPETGALVQVIVLIAPPSRMRDRDKAPAVDMHMSVPVIDRSPWLDDQEEGSFTNKVLRIESNLGITFTKSETVLYFTDRVAVTRHIGCGNVLVGVAADNKLIDLSASTGVFQRVADLDRA